MKKTKVKGSKRVLLMSDLHCGSEVGLTPVKWQQNEHQARMYTQYLEWLKEWKKFDIVLIAGDCVDGKAKKDGSIGLISADRAVQVDMASECIRATGCSNVVIASGTPYHVSSDGEDWEKILADKIGAQFTDHGFYSINGVNFNIKHKISSGGMPHTKYAPLGKEIEANKNWFMQGVETLSNVIVRGHTHQFAQVDSGTCLGFVLPALQGLGSKFGRTQCSGVVHYGLVVMDVASPTDIQWKVMLSDGGLQKNLDKVL